MGDIAREPARILGVLAAEERLRAFAALVLGARDVAEVAERAGMSRRETVRALSLLQQAGLASRTGDGWVARPEVLQKTVVAAAPDDKPEDHRGATPSDAAVLRSFLRGGRLVAMPAARSKRLIVLDHLARVFEPGVRYGEREVSVILRAFHEDYASLRRHLVDEGFLSREAGEYWRTGDTIDI